jgi:hypothetical protein
MLTAWILPQPVVLWYNGLISQAILYVLQPGIQSLDMLCTSDSKHELIVAIGWDDGMNVLHTNEVFSDAMEQFCGTVKVRYLLHFQASL